MECIPAELASLITSSVGVPTIGIGAGARCDGQVLVFHDLLGLPTDDRTPPKFVRRYAEVRHKVGNLANVPRLAVSWTFS